MVQDLHDGQVCDRLCLPGGCRPVVNDGVDRSSERRVVTDIQRNESVAGSVDAPVFDGPTATMGPQTAGD